MSLLPFLVPLGTTVCFTAFWHPKSVQIFYGTDASSMETVSPKCSFSVSKIHGGHAPAFQTLTGPHLWRIFPHCVFSAVKYYFKCVVEFEREVSESDDVQHHGTVLRSARRLIRRSPRPPQPRCISSKQHRIIYAPGWIGVERKSNAKSVSVYRCVSLDGRFLVHPNTCRNCKEESHYQHP